MISTKKRFEILKRDGFRCQYCGRNGRDVSLEIDHIIPKKKGGTNDMENLTTACRECNLGKGDTELSDIRTYSGEELKKQYENELKRRFYNEWNKQGLGVIGKGTQVLLAIYILDIIESLGGYREDRSPYDWLIDEEKESFISIMERVSDDSMWIPENNKDPERYGLRLNYVLTESMDCYLKNKSVLYKHSVNKNIIS